MMESDFISAIYVYTFSCDVTAILYPFLLLWKPQNKFLFKCGSLDFQILTYIIYNVSYIFMLSWPHFLLYNYFISSNENFFTIYQQIKQFY